MASRKITDLSVLLADAWLAIRDEYLEAHPGHDLILTATYRSPEEQMHAFQQGRHQAGNGTWVLDNPKTRAGVVTNLDGTPGHRSKHNENPARALDMAIVKFGKVSWHLADYEVVGQLAE